jgi:putative phosphoribosyl transferase
MEFRDRKDAGIQLAEQLKKYQSAHPVIFGIPRGGIPVAFEVALALDSPLDVLLVKKIGLPQQPEFAIAALDEDGDLWVPQEIQKRFNITEERMLSMQESKLRELSKLRSEIRKFYSPIDVAGRSAIIIDDGLATGATAQAAVQMLRKHGAAEVNVAVPVSPSDVGEIESSCDHFSNPPINTIGTFLK